MTAPVRNVLGVIGSLRAASFNRRLLYHAAAVAPPRLRLDVAPDLIRLPLFDEDLEADGLPAEVVTVQDRIRAADGVLLATPEYNFGVPGPVKNFVDWASRPPGRGAFVGKPVALIGASTGRVGGTVQAQGQLRISLAVIGAHVMPSPPILVADAHTRFEEELLVDEPTDKILGIALSRFLDFIDALAPRVPADV
jgi:chromate reductase, NAD(P)H dehydrogenase (quinone)